MAKPQQSYGELKSIFEQTPVGRIHWQLAMLSIDDEDYPRFISIVNKAIDLIVQQIVKNPQSKKDFSEDELTQIIVDALNHLSFEATHDTKIGGHCDIVISFRGYFLWLGEAKIYKGQYEWLYKGFMQLISRYSTGSKYHNSGGIIIYTYKPRINTIMSKWQAKLKEKSKPKKIYECSENPLAFFSEHEHDNTGLTFTTRHIPISLYFAPKDVKKKPKGKFKNSPSKNKL